MKVKPVFLAIFLLQFFLLTAGCETTKNVVVGIADGAPKDARNTWNVLAKLDAWIRKNLW